MKGPQLGENITWPEHVGPRGRRAPSTQKVKPQTSSLVVVVLFPSRPPYPCLSAVSDFGCHGPRVFVVAPPALFLPFFFLRPPCLRVSVTHHHPPAKPGIGDSIGGACFDGNLYPVERPRGKPPGHGRTHGTDGLHQSGHANHIGHPHVPTTCDHPTPDGPGQAPQTPLLPTVMPLPARRKKPLFTGAPSTTYNSDAAHTCTTGTTRTPASMHALEVRMPQRHHPSTGTANRRHRMPPLCTPTAATNCPALQPEPLCLPRGHAAPRPLPPIRGIKPLPQHAARSLSRISCTPAGPASLSSSPTTCYAA